MQKLITKLEEDHPTQIVYGEHSVSDWKDVEPGHEYTSLMTIYKSVHVTFEKKILHLAFDYNNREEIVKQALAIRKSGRSSIEVLDTIEKNNIVCGYYYDQSKVMLMVIDQQNLIKMYNLDTMKVEGYTTYLSVFFQLFDLKMSSPLTEWTDIKILDKKFPVGFLLAYHHGLIGLMDRLNMDYQIYPVSKQVELSNTSIVLRFNDRKIIFDRYPLRNSMIVSGLTFFDLKQFDLEEMDHPGTYDIMLRNAGYSPNYSIGIRDTFDLFVDGITYDTLKQMGKPTTFAGLLVEATRMLQTHKHDEAASMANHRMRSFERVNAVVYNELARSLSTYRKKQTPGTSFSANPQAVLMRIISDPAMMGSEDINPVHELKLKTSFTMTGVGGRSSEAFVINDRKYPADGPGILSEATPDSGAVAITASSPPNATLANVRGFINHVDVKKLEPAQLLSTPALLMPGSTQDDRLNDGMRITQSSKLSLYMETYKWSPP